jgi:hypothetical protein
MNDLCYGKAIGLLDRLITKAHLDDTNIRLVPSLYMTSALRFIKDGKGLKKKKIPNLSALVELTTFDVGKVYIRDQSRIFVVPEAEYACYRCRKTKKDCNYNSALSGNDRVWKLRHHGKSYLYAFTL